MCCNPIEKRLVKKEFVEDKKQSPNWGKYHNGSKERIKGFPFNEGLPKRYSGKEYKLTLVSGEQCRARVDDSREFMSEGLEWEILSPTNLYMVGQSASSNVVAAWKKIN